MSHTERILFGLDVEKAAEKSPLASSC
jgi:hypothetical protein